MTAVSKTGAEVEAEQLKTKDLLDNKEINQAALKFKHGVVQSKKMVNSMSKKSVARVYNAFMEFPLGDAYPKFRDKQEQSLFNLTLELVDAKNLMIQHVLANKRELETQLNEARKASETGDTNG